MNKKVIVFDFDGTVMDGSVCILTALKKTCEMHNVQMPPDDKLKGFIGPPIWTSMRKAGFNEKDIAELLVTYRKLCRQPEIIKGFRFIDGIENILIRLKQTGFRLIVVSMRTQQSLQDVDNATGYSKYFDLVYGRQGDGDSENKADLIRVALEKIGAEVKDCVLIGDSVYDEQGAEECGMDFIAVLYGFGYEKSEDVGKHVMICPTVSDLDNVLFG